MKTRSSPDGTFSLPAASPALRLLGVAALLVLATTPLRAWCDLVFKDVAPNAWAVVIVRYDDDAAASRRLEVVEVLKGQLEATTLILDTEELKSYRLKNGDQLVMALSTDARPIRTVPGTGTCTAVSILPIHKGKLLGRDRLDYDFSRKTMTLEQLRDELIALFQSGS